VNTLRISRLLAPFLDSAQLSDAQLESISTYIDLLLRWNARINLTAVRDPEAIVTRHFGESLFAARHLFPVPSHPVPSHPDSPHRDVILSAESVLRRKTDSSEESMHLQTDLIDLGSGAGFPGLPIKLWAPRLHTTLIESNHRKATFLREVCRASILTNVNVVSSRAEDIPDLKAGTVTMRAVERFESALPLARGFVAGAGRLALLIGASQLDHARRLLPDLNWLDPVPIPLSTSRSLVIGIAAHEPDW